MAKISKELLTEEHIIFDKENNYEGRHISIEEFLPIRGIFCVVLRDENILAQVICIPNTINGFNSCLYINLKVRKDQSEEIVKELITNTMEESKKSNISFGYYWLKSNKGIETKTWYRPLIVKRAKALNYRINRKANYNLPNTDEYTILETDSRDFKHINSNTLLKLTPNEEELTNLSKTIKFYTIFLKQSLDIMGIVGYRIINIHDLNNEHSAIDLVYFDSVSMAAVPVLSSLFRKLKKENHNVIYGVLMSELETAADELSLTFTGELRLNIINLIHNITKISKIAMLIN